jgi:hypothetical protein
VLARVQAAWGACGLFATMAPIAALANAFALAAQRPAASRMCERSLENVASRSAASTARKPGCRSRATGVRNACASHSASGRTARSRSSRSTITERRGSSATTW